MAVSRRPSPPRSTSDEGATLAGPCAPAEVRCGCGSLLARLVTGGVELKCRRCKRTWTVPLQPE